MAIQSHEYYMQQAIDIAKLGSGHVQPNPLVGAVLINNITGEILLKDYHRQYKHLHAEALILNRALQQYNQEFLNNCSLYITLEPCNHYGHTPPCTQSIIQSGIKNVIIGCIDVNPYVKSQGIQTLQNAGINIIFGILEQECQYLNRKFFHYIKTRTPWITLKVAITLNGKMTNYPHKFITNKLARHKVHELRSEHAGMITTAQTVLDDNCQLNVRNIPNAFQPQRLIIDRQQKLTHDELIFTSTGGYTQSFASLDHIMEYASNNHLASLMIEAGSRFSSYILENNLFNELYVFQNPCIIASNNNLDLYNNSLLSLDLKFLYSEFLESNVLNVYC